MDEIFKSTDLFNFSNYLNDLSGLSTMEDLDRIFDNTDNSQTITSPLILDDPLKKGRTHKATVSRSATKTKKTTKITDQNQTNKNETTNHFAKNKTTQNSSKKKCVVIKKIKKKRPKITFPTPVDESGNPREPTKTEKRKRLLERNRINAIRSRKRKKNYIKKLETESKSLKLHTNVLSNQLGEMRQTNKFLKDESKRLKQLVLQTFSCNINQLDHFLNNIDGSDENIRHFIDDQKKPNKNGNVILNEKENENENEKQEENENETEKERINNMEKDSGKVNEMSSWKDEVIGTSGFWGNLITIPSSFNNQDLEGSFELLPSVSQKSQDISDKKQIFGTSLLIVLFAIGLLFSITELCVLNHCIEIGSSTSLPSTIFVPHLMPTAKPIFVTRFSHSQESPGKRLTRFGNQKDTFYDDFKFQLKVGSDSCDMYNQNKKNNPISEKQKDTSTVGSGTPGEYTKADEFGRLSRKTTSRFAHKFIRVSRAYECSYTYAEQTIKSILNLTTLGLIIAFLHQKMVRRNRPRQLSNKIWLIKKNNLCKNIEGLLKILLDKTTDKGNLRFQKSFLSSS
ncbi:cyclic-amp response element binding protein [Anaeramoeba flamelloides]|uniref:Cyclic-amp response element binding protein n=1 Tax=Anaeramoeba flamelloides TaxID=1746091 RepID=A0ABQ8YPE2_9EUKA|nr:cyclic-amp response element binding protein [Anaeramoeba flamelloides]